MLSSVKDMSRIMKKTTFWFPTWSDTNQVVQLQKMARGFKFRIYKEEGLFHLYVAKTKALISFAVTAKLICVFVFAYATCWFSHDAAHIISVKTTIIKKNWVVENTQCFPESKYYIPLSTAFNSLQTFCCKPSWEHLATDVIPSLQLTHCRETFFSHS